MNKFSEAALSTIKKVLDKAVNKGRIFKTTEQAIDAINAYNYLAKVCGDIETIAAENKKITGGIINQATTNDKLQTVN